VSTFMTALDFPKLAGWLSTEEAAEVLGTTKQNLHRLLKTGQFASARRVGGDNKPVYIISKDEVMGLKQRREDERAARVAGRFAITEARRLQQEANKALLAELIAEAEAS
jgi:Helix-turn-helix domain